VARRRATTWYFVASALTALAAFAVAAVLREAGSLEKLDLAVHDRLVDAVAPEPAKDPSFLVILEEEPDLARFGFPLSDDTLAQLIERIAAADPVAIGIDKYRDHPVAPGTERLDALLAKSDRLFWVARFGATPNEAVPAPKALPERFASCGDLVDDPDGNVRRALLYLDEGERVCYTMAFQLARHAAAAKQLSAVFAQIGPARVDFGAASLAAIDAGDGPYATIDTAGFQVAAPTAAGVAHIETVRFADVMDGRVPPEKMRGRVVLFGSAAQSLRDFFNVPSADAPEGTTKITGVQVHALIASYLLRAASGEIAALRLLPWSASLAVTGFFAVVAALIGCARRRPLLVISAGLALLALYAAATLSLAAYGRYLSAAAPALAIALAIAIGIARSAWLEHKERTELMLVFSRHVSREIADAVWQQRDKLIHQGVLLPRPLEATVLFLDIRGFTTIFEKLPADKAVPWLNRGLGVMTETLMDHKGVVARFIGDAILACFGAPLPRETERELAQDARNAVQAALAIGPALDRLNSEFSAEGLPSIRVRIGINTGKMTQCSVGTSRRMEFTVLGDTVNVASRLESFDLPDDGSTARVLVGERTLALAGGDFATRSVGELMLKGKSVPVPVHQVLSKR